MYKEVSMRRTYIQSHLHIDKPYLLIFIKILQVLVAFLCVSSMNGRTATTKKVPEP